MTCLGWVELNTRVLVEGLDLTTPPFSHQSLLDKYATATALALQATVTQRFGSSSQQRDQGDEGW
jgi:hypothetical protein